MIKYHEINILGELIIEEDPLQSSPNRHNRSKLEGVRYPCNQCEFSSTTADYLKKHIQSIHEGVRYPCNQCEFSATSKDNLKKHIQSIHEGVRYPCNQYTE